MKLKILFGFLISFLSGSPSEGDTIQIEIEEAATDSTYQLNDKYLLPTVAAASLYFNGGVDGVDEYNFEVLGAVDKFPDYLVSTSSPQVYSYLSGGKTLNFFLSEGDLPFAINDLYEFYIEYYQYSYRKKVGTGSWSTWGVDKDVTSQLDLLEDGVSVLFETFC